MTLALITPHIPTSCARGLSPRMTRIAIRTRTWRVLVLLLAVALLNGVDLAYTLFANHVPMFQELNPLAALFLQQGMISGLISFKVLLALSGLAILWKLRACRLTLAACWVLLLTYAGLSVLWYQWACVVTDSMQFQLTMAPQ